MEIIQFVEFPMFVKIEKWGEDLAVRIPAGLAEELGWVEGTEIRVENAPGSLVFRPTLPESVGYSLNELLDGVEPETLHEETDWGGPVGLEAW